MKKFVITIVTLSLVLYSIFNQSVSAKSTSEWVRVEIPEFDVRLNGELYNSWYSEYPILTYNGITYLPLTYDNLNFLGLKFRLYENAGERDGVIDGISVCNAPIRSNNLEIYKRENKNSGQYYFAQVQNIETYINLNILESENARYNNTRNYPILFFRNIYYIPLEDNIVINTLGWDFSYNYKTGIVLDSRNAVRPQEFDDRILDCSLNLQDISRYYLSKDGYVEFKAFREENSTFGDFVWQFKGNEKKSFDFTPLLGNVKYLDKEYSDQGFVPAKIKPMVSNNIFVLFGVNYLPPAPSTGYISNVLIVIDLQNCDVLFCEEIRT